MKILHLASFIGNIGDNASHLGFHNILRKIVGNNYEIEELEIRRFYKNYNLPDKKLFDINFVNYANNFDLLFIGGGGFLDYWVESSYTGTTIDISEKVFDLIQIPVIFGSVGSLPHKPIPNGNKEKYERFLNYVDTRDNIQILLRNDGSKKHLTEVFGKELINHIPEILDNAFFFQPVHNSILLTDKEFVLINTTSDQLKMISSSNTLNEEDYHVELIKVINYFLKETNYDIIFALHIYKDIQEILVLLSDIDDFYIRSRIKIAPYIQGYTGANYIFNLYFQSSLNLGMRFHSNVCSINFGVPTIGLAALDRVVNMYESLGITENLFVKIKTDFGDHLINNYKKQIKGPRVPGTAPT